MGNDFIYRLLEAQAIAASPFVIEWGLHFRFHPLRFVLKARELIYFPRGKSGNLLRGAFGLIFRRIACVPQCRSTQQCEISDSCPYARMFEPSALEHGPSGFADWPRPFVFRATHLDGQSIRPGEAFFFDLNLFDLKNPAIAYLVLAFSQLAQDGLGPGRGRADLVEVAQLDAEGKPAIRIYDGASGLLQQEGLTPMELSLQPGTERVERVRVRFVTPTELKSGKRVTHRPAFGVLAGRIRDRLSKLRELYGEGPLSMDFREFGERAALVQMTSCKLGKIDVERRSSRTGQFHSIGGFVGEAEYEGELAEFVPFLRAARWTGVGRQTVWGKGEVRVEASCF
jgi:hypothetical protein